MNAVNTSTRLTHGGACPNTPGGVPREDTRGASPHALPFAPTRPNGTGHHLRAILWGLGRAFTPNPNTFTSQRLKALRDAFIRVGAKARPGRCGHGGHAWPAARPSKASVTPPVSGWRPCWCGGSPQSADAVVTASFQRFRGITPPLRPCWWWLVRQERPNGVLVLADFQRLACGQLKLGAINSVKEL